MQTLPAIQPVALSCIAIKTRHSRNLNVTQTSHPGGTSNILEAGGYCWVHAWGCFSQYSHTLLGFGWSNDSYYSLGL